MLGWLTTIYEALYNFFSSIYSLIVNLFTIFNTIFYCVNGVQQIIIDYVPVAISTCFTLCFTLILADFIYRYVTRIT